MTKTEFRQIASYEGKIKALTRQVERLNEKQTDGMRSASDVVQSSSGEGNATVIGHATVRGTDVEYLRREERLRECYRQITQAQRAQGEALDLILTCDDPETQTILLRHFVDGVRYRDIFEVNMDAPTMRKRAERWIKKVFPSVT